MLLSKLALAVAALALVACAHRSPAVSASKGAPRAYPNAEARELACLDLQDHVVALYADEYLRERGEHLAPLERQWFVRSWGEELAKAGSLDRFDRACFASLTPAKYACGAAAETTDGLVACMRFEADP